MEQSYCYTYPASVLWAVIICLFTAKTPPISFAFLPVTQKLTPGWHPNRCLYTLHASGGEKGVRVFAGELGRGCFWHVYQRHETSNHAVNQIKNKGVKKSHKAEIKKMKSKSAVDCKKTMDRRCSCAAHISHSCLI